MRLVDVIKWRQKLGECGVFQLDFVEAYVEKRKVKTSYFFLLQTNELSFFILKNLSYKAIN